jgi:hypothetical protein
METIIPSDITRLFQEHGTEVILEAGETLFHQGEASDAVYYVLGGSLAVYAKDNSDAPALLNCVEAGHLVGELGVITQNPRSATLIANSRVVLLRISVTDAGPGIPPDDRQRIFEKFTRASDAEHMARKGTGLGADVLPYGGGGARRLYLGRCRTVGRGMLRTRSTSTRVSAFQHNY